MVEISNERFRDFVRAEQTIELLREAVKTLPAYKADETILLLLGESGKEVAADAE